MEKGASSRHIYSQNRKRAFSVFYDSLEIQRIGVDLFALCTWSLSTRVTESGSQYKGDLYIEGEYWQFVNKSLLLSK